VGKRSDHRKSFYETVLLIVLLGLSGGLCFGQEGANVTQSGATGSSTAQGTATFRASSRLVLVDVVVTDKAGQAVKGLKATDFTILEDGKPQPIRAFESHVWQKTPAPVQKINLPPIQYTNFTGQEPNSAVNVVLLDILNTPQHDQQYARKQMIEFLRELPPGQKTALFVLGTKLRMIQGFTGDSDRLVQAAESILSNTSPVLTTESQYEDTASDIAYFADMASGNGGSLGNLKASLMNALNRDVAFQAIERARMTLDAFVVSVGGRVWVFWTQEPVLAFW
jgi:VWFA-related protein